MLRLRVAFTIIVSLGDFEGACRSFEDAVAVTEKCSPEHRDLIRTLEHLGLAYVPSLNITQTVVFCPTLQLYLATLIAFSPLHPYARYHKAGEKRLAEQTFNKALQHRQNIMGENHPSVLEATRNLAVVTASKHFGK